MVNIIKSCPERLGSRMKTLDRWRIHPETKAEIKRFIDALAARQKTTDPICPMV